MPNLYVTEQGAHLERDHERILVVRDGAVLLDVPLLKIEGIVLVGRVGVTTPVLHLLLERGVGLVLLSQQGRFRGRLSGDDHTNVALRRAQYRASEETSMRLLAGRAFVQGKLWNSRVRCLRVAAYDHDPMATRAARCLARLQKETLTAQDLTSVRALEAQGSRVYFATVRSNLPTGWEFPSRQRRPPPDPMNVLLSATYMMLTEAVYSAIIAAGLDPYCGFYHSDRWGRPSLALDLMEEFRPLIADSVVMTVIKNRMLRPQGFVPGPKERPVLLRPDKYAVLLQAFSRRLRTRVMVPGTGRRTTYHRLLEYQARRFAAFVSGRAPTYTAHRTR